MLTLLIISLHKAVDNNKQKNNNSKEEEKNSQPYHFTELLSACVSLNMLSFKLDKASGGNRFEVLSSKCQGQEVQLSRAKLLRFFLFS